ncbi:ubiquitin-conjugating enzyme E2 U-like [Dendronephthya gigantea]|uniref:ubiquitin-conjugating enzyme E2 U-like n=1 Tax=Dendronephthya gigantea TaxID=151771 RepID=UPI00106B1067|nr:ubiquitin-conjugating enzyme E2 U-like [Dendronephthya gigantea]
MKSRAHMLLEKEFVKLQKQPIWGISAQPLNDDDFFIWEAKVNGLKDTLWEEGVFKLYLKFSKSYNIYPPEVSFITIPYHPNVDPSTGKPCVDFLDNAGIWQDSFNVGYILLSIQALLANPVLKNAVNKEAAFMFCNKIEKYREIVMNCVLASKRLDAKLHLNTTEEDESPIVELTDELEEQKPQKNFLRSSKVSFGDYLKLWKGIATSNPSDSPVNALNEYLKTDNKLQKAHFELSKADVEKEIRIQLAEHRKLMYGTLACKNEKYADSVDSPRSLPTRVNMLRHVYIGKPNTTEPNTPEPPSLRDDLVDLDKEAIDLVNWSRSLSTEQTYD